MMNYCVVDLEATCSSDGSRPYEESETIEIGAVLVKVIAGGIFSEFQSFVRPTRNPRLTDFCSLLTGIGQEQVDQAMGFPEVFDRFCVWLGAANLDGFCSWGSFDRQQLQRDCKFHGIKYPFSSHINLASIFRKKYRRSKGRRGAMKLLGLVPSGAEHRGIDDARNIASMVPYLF